MRKTNHRMAVVQALATNNEETLGQLRHLSGPEIRELLLWLDESGLALYFLRRVQERDALKELPQLFREELESREKQNRVRVELMFAEFARVNESLKASGVRYAFLKGFTLFPDFCPDITARHHNDIDVLVHQDSIRLALDVVASLGYRLHHVFPSGEQKLFLPLPRVASGVHEIYKPADVGILELHLSMCESPDDIPLLLPDPFGSMALQTVEGITFPSLSTPDKLLVQILHTFRHLTLMWIRVSWLYEISLFVSKEREAGWWDSFCARAGAISNVRHACGLMLTLTQKLFGNRIPDRLQAWCIDGLPGSLRGWVDSASTRWALSSASESRSPVLIQRQFLSSDLQWGQYLRRHLLPWEGLALSIHDRPMEVFRAAVAPPVSTWLTVPRLTFRHVQRVISLARDVSAMTVTSRNHKA